MGSTLTNTQPKDTYKSLLKTSDSSELSATAKYVSDGNGNDSPLALSTSAVGIGTNSPSTKFVVSNAGAAGLEVEPTGLIQSYNRDTGNYQTITLDASNVLFRPAGVEKVRITADGLTFNGDTAAANALDDYEEGTFTATAIPSTSGTITLSVNSCTYTKIGRQVTIKGQLVVGSVASPVGTLVTIGGLPFTTINSVAGRGAGSATYFPAVGSGSLPLNYQLQNAVEWNLVLTASTIAAGDEFYITLTYFV